MGVVRASPVVAVGGTGCRGAQCCVGRVMIQHAARQGPRQPPARSHLGWVRREARRKRDDRRKERGRRRYVWAEVQLEAVVEGEAVGADLCEHLVSRPCRVCGAPPVWAECILCTGLVHG